MKFIAKNLNLIGLLLLAGFATAAAGLYFGVPQKAQAAPTKLGQTEFTCPMHPKVVRNSASDCPECGMKLVARQSGETVIEAKTGEGCCAEPAAPVAAAGCPHLASMNNAAPTAPAGCCPHQ